ncbi:hypothetical protein SUGI_0988890 [Cryptomeria japonica]|uniref:uncharacterized protein LOC131029533 n=1 Tax=Cryptomeria japonica TaxID=3369 RepID=UPI002414851C|nr:uncharacterized protein LOC131029533 [Cryptomeria japonica]GLJ46882.1 hypothetical protein SUGI_0988890 [Cryptomeria japonica]
MSAVQVHSVLNSRIFHSEPHQLNRGRSTQASSIHGYCFPRRIWRSEKYPSLFLTISHKPTCITSAISKGSKANPEQNSKGGGQKKQKTQENLWSLDNELLKRDSPKKAGKNPKKKRGAGGFSKIGRKKNNAVQSKTIVSAPMPVETETVLQTQEPVIKPVWSTFVSSVSGSWKGVGAVFSPVTAEMEPISLGERNEYLYDCYILSKVEAVSSPSQESKQIIHRKTNWVVMNPFGEQGQREVTIQDDQRGKTFTPSIEEKQNLPLYETTVLPSSDVMEEEFMHLEPGLVFFEDGSYSRGPLVLDVKGSVDDSRYYISPTYKIEQCLVRGCHKRLRLVHTIALKEGGAEIEVLRLAVYEEEWMGPSHLELMSETEKSSLNPISNEKRISPTELVGLWKVFEISATAILDDLEEEKSEMRPSYVYLCMETLKRRSLPEFPVHFVDADALDLQDVTVLWLPGGITAYVDTKEDGVLTIGVGWYSSDGTNLVMERDYSNEGKLLEVRSKSEIKRRWTDGSLQ